MTEFKQLDKLIYDFGNKYIEIGRRKLFDTSGRSDLVYETIYDKKGNTVKQHTWYPLNPNSCYVKLRDKHDAAYNDNTVNKTWYDAYLQDYWDFLERS